MGAFVSFSGRVGRSAYWLAFVAGIVSYGIYVAVLASIDPWKQPQIYTTYSGKTKIYWGTTEVQFIYGLFAVVGLFLAVVGLSVSVRRWHDLNKSGWWVLISLVPIVGGLYAFIMQGFMPGDPGPNAYDLGASTGAAPQQPARPRDALQALPVAAILSVVGSAMLIAASSNLIDAHLHRSVYMTGRYSYGRLVFVIVVAVLAWLFGSQFGNDLVDRLGFRGVSIIADVVCGIAMVSFATRTPGFALLLVVVFFGLALRISAHTAYRSMMSELAARLPFARVNAFFDALPFLALLLVPNLVEPIWMKFPSVRTAWLYAVFFAFSALFAAVAFPALPWFATPSEAPEPATETRLDAEWTPLDAAEWS